MCLINSRRIYRMDYRKAVTIFQVVMLIYAIGLCIFHLLISGIRGLGPGGSQAPPVNTDYYIWVAAFLTLGVILKLVFRQNDLILPIVGLMASVAIFFLLAIGSINFEHYMTYFDYIAILLPISSILGLWIANLNR
jgi:hypothetical protein